MPQQRTEAQLIAFVDDEANDDVPDEEIVGEIDFDEMLRPLAAAILTRSSRSTTGRELPPGAAPADPDDIPNLSTSDKGLIGAFNRKHRRKRRKRFDKKVDDGFAGTTIVSEGDSWFQYPVQPKFFKKWPRDIVDHLSERDDYNIRSLGAAGDWLSNMMSQKEYKSPISLYEPTVFLISGGGNDLVGKERLKFLLRGFKSGEGPDYYLGGAIETALDQMETLYTTLFDDLRTSWPDLRVICHGYAYGQPDGGKWLGDPMKAIGIKDEDLQAAIFKLIINRFNEMLSDLAAQYSYHFIDCRPLVRKNQWYDELHPKSRAFAKIAVEFQKAIDAP